MRETNWLEIANVAASFARERKILKDADGNCYRLTYRDGAERAAAIAAGQQISREASIDALKDTLTAYEIPILVGDVLHTS